MGKFHTPLGNLTFITEETTKTSFLQGKFGEISFSIQVNQPFDFEEIDFNFIQSKMNNFSQIRAKTDLFLRNILYTQPKQLGFSHYKDKLASVGWVGKPNKNLNVGSRPNLHLLKLDWKQQESD
ncbi:hypothetical protein [Neisseria sp. HMSC064E01]|uniref:hypothetical protein n=1 Tax=Neisseria sp. HMSC064E01 TaxID=1715052 RepID=UPI001FED8401|nr:hypothetical protein [Neisseria sp. HMSC064E01]